ncbi:hypothetical protein Y032_0027g1630 [Ancylostoma ceylanicum]|nr:hypothetical protein Y032_0027g1630 [Ancylostoma ceylanicum]
MTREQVWEMYGCFLIEYTMEIGWDELVRSMSPNLKGFLDNLDSLHYFIDHVVYKANLRGPSFRCEENPDGSLTLHYFTGRPGLYPIVKENFGQALRLNAADFCNALPYHVIMDEHCHLIQTGRELANHIPKELLAVGTPIMRIFEVNRPQIPFDFDNICNFINAVFVLQVKTSPTDMRKQREQAERLEDGNGSIASTAFHQGHHLKLKGQMMLLSDSKSLIYLCSPYVTSIPELMQYGMRLTAMPLHDATRDLILLNQQRLTDVEVNLQLEANNEQLEILAKDLDAEKRKTERILRDMLPSSVASQLMSGEHIEAREYEHATVMFSDVPNFQSVLSNSQPKDIVQMLNDLFHRFDRLVLMHKVFKVETVGDSYLTVGGIPEQLAEHAEIICHVAIGMLWEARAVFEPVTKKSINVRIGIHSGPLVAGVVALCMPRYCLFGETVSMASSIEMNGLPGKIHCSEKTYKYAMQTGRFDFTSRGRILIKGKGEMETYLLVRSTKKSVWEIVDRERDVQKNSIDGYEELETGMSFAAQQHTIVRPLATQTSKTCSIS